MNLGASGDVLRYDHTHGRSRGRRWIAEGLWPHSHRHEAISSRFHTVAAAAEGLCHWCLFCPIQISALDVFLDGFGISAVFDSSRWCVSMLTREICSAFDPRVVGKRLSSYVGQDAILKKESLIFYGTVEGLKAQHPSSPSSRPSI